MVRESAWADHTRDGLNTVKAHPQRAPLVSATLNARLVMKSRNRRIMVQMGRCLPLTKQTVLRDCDS